MNELKLFFKSLRDYFTTPMLKLALLPFVISAVVLTGAFFATADFGLDTFKSSVLHIQSSQVTVENGQVTSQSDQDATYEGSSILHFLLNNSVTSWMVGFLYYVLGLFATAMLSIFVALIVVGFLTPQILQHLKERNYPDIELKGYGNIFFSGWIVLKNTVLMLLLFILLIPLYLIPVVNVIALNYPLYYLFKRMLEFDVTSEMMTRDEFEEIHYKGRRRTGFRMLVLYLLSLIPLMGLVIPVFYIIYLGNGYFEALSPMRSRENGSQNTGEEKGETE